MDSDRSAALVESGARALREGSGEQAREAIAEALHLWRAPAVADVVMAPFAQAEADRLEDLRMVGLETRIEADLATGRHAALVPELQGLGRRVSCGSVLSRNIFAHRLGSGPQVSSTGRTCPTIATCSRGWRTSFRDWVSRPAVSWY